MSGAAERADGEECDADEGDERGDGVLDALGCVRNTEPISSVTRTFAALADPTRVEIVRRLGLGPSTVTALADAHDMSLTGFLKHVKVLEDAGLVRTVKEGRVRRCELDRKEIDAASAWFEDLRAMWDRRLDRIERYVTDEDTRKRKQS